jgi:hypothetical protein
MEATALAGIGKERALIMVVLVNGCSEIKLEIASPVMSCGAVSMRQEKNDAQE